VLLVGDSGVGKTCLVMRFISDRFEDHLPATVGEQHQLTADRMPAQQSCSLCGMRHVSVAGGNATRWNHG
jgi:ATP-dependent Clp protease ATP-binding subunit ClpA